MSSKLLVLTLLQMILLASVFFINTTRAEEAWRNITIHIREDGDIDPPNAPIVRIDDYTYKLTRDIEITSSEPWTTAIIISRNNIVLDGNGHRVKGPCPPYSAYYMLGNIRVRGGPCPLGSMGIEIRARANVTLKNIWVSGFDTGIHLVGVNHVIYNNTISDVNTGIFAGWSTDVLILNNTIHGVRKIGIDAYSNNTILGNTLYDIALEGIKVINDNIVSNNTLFNINMTGIKVDGNNNVISENTLINIGHAGVYVHGNNTFIHGNRFLDTGLVVEMITSTNNTIINNTVNNKPLVYLEEVSDIEISEAGQVIVVNSRNITIRGLTIFNVPIGIRLFNTSNSRIENNTIFNNITRIIELIDFGGGSIHSVSPSYHGINAEGDGNNISNNVIYNIKGNGISINGNNVIILNNIIRDVEIGIIICGNNSVVANNYIDRADMAINLLWYFVVGEDGTVYNVNINNTVSNNTIVTLREGITIMSDHNVISGNKVFCDNGEVGIMLQGSNNTIVENIIWRCHVAIYATWGSLGNKIYLNSFIDYKIPGIIANFTEITWDDGLRGNYWSEHQCVDNNSDGICENPYTSIIGEPGNIDRYPLRWPIGISQLPLGIPASIPMAQTWREITKPLVEKPVVSTETTTQATSPHTWVKTPVETTVNTGSIIPEPPAWIWLAIASFIAAILVVLFAKIKARHSAT